MGESQAGGLMRQASGVGAVAGAGVGAGMDQMKGAQQRADQAAASGKARFAEAVGQGRAEASAVADQMKARGSALISGVDELKGATTERLKEVYGRVHGVLDQLDLVTRELKELTRHTHDSDQHEEGTGGIEDR